jgi:hypothetical protein
MRAMRASRWYGRNTCEYVVIAFTGCFSHIYHRESAIGGIKKVLYSMILFYLQGRLPQSCEMNDGSSTYQHQRETTLLAEVQGASQK